MSTHRILHIEEDRHFAESLRRLLMKDGFAVEHELRGDEGLKRALEDPPQAILLAIRLQKKDGFQILEALKQDPRTQRIPVIMLSDLSSREEIQRCFDAGAYEYVIKAHSHPRDVAACLVRALGSKPGFTLPEWIVVFAVLLLVSGLAWVQVSRYRAASMRAVDAGGSSNE